PARALAKRALLRLGLWGRPVLLVGAGATGARVARALEATPLDGLHPVAAFDDDPALHGTALGTVPVVGPLDAVEPYARTHGIRHAVVTPDTLHPRVRDDLVTGASKTFDVVQFVPTLAGLPSRDVRVSDLDGLLALEVRVGLSSPTNRALKRTFDVVATTLGGLLITPLLLALALLVRTSGPGPILYGQRRIGRHGRPFTIWKFRTMVPNADAILETHLRNHPHLRAEWDADHKLRNDPRITPVGALLRRTSLDELPQLWNVLTGDMSLVGPRPITDDERPKYGDAFALYARVRPGITGVWQVSGRNDTTYEERVTLDAHYVRNWNVWIDLVTLWKTVDVVLNDEGAY
ncbi:MAG: undecaprenyl-phosphate galactose phosphotransferase WbaP, partial [Trueperaceae bacterium]|nr:undecaprenyl-phosphate galactose phosphotransferase WbaP [Trueperaceae bacterium]